MDWIFLKEDNMFLQFVAFLHNGLAKVPEIHP